MTLDERNLLQGLCREAGLTPRRLLVVDLVVGEGLGTRLAWEVLRLDEPTLSIRSVRATFWRALRQLHAHAWQRGEGELLRQLCCEAAGHHERMDGSIEARIITGDWEHAEHLLDAVRPPRPSCPPTPTYDDAGRRVGTRDPMVDRADAVRVIIAVRHQQ